MTKPKPTEAAAEIDVWEVHPHLDTSFDYAIFDDHVRAFEYAKDVLESIFDNLGDDDESQITIKLKTMTRGDFDEVYAQSEAAAAGSTGQCRWKQCVDDQWGDVWFTDCGGTFQLTDETPKDHHMRFCCYCGRRLVQVPWVDVESE